MKERYFQLMEKIRLLRAEDVTVGDLLDIISVWVDRDDSDYGCKRLETILGIVERQECKVSLSIKTGIEKARASGVRIGRKPKQVLSQAQKEEIRNLRITTGASLRELARKFAITIWLAQSICKGVRTEEHYSRKYRTILRRSVQK